MSAMTNEPILTVASVTATASALITLLVSFDVVHLNEQQTGALMGAVAVIAPFVVLTARRWVYTVDTVNHMDRTEKPEKIEKSGKSGSRK